MAASRSTHDQLPPLGGAAELGLPTPRAAGVAGIVFSILFASALVLLRRSLGSGLDTETVVRNVTDSGSTPALSVSTWCPSPGSPSCGSSPSSATASASVKTSSLPPSGYETAAVLILSISFFEPIVIMFAVWVSAISTHVLVSNGRQAAEGTGL